MAKDGGFVKPVKYPQYQPLAVIYGIIEHDGKILMLIREGKKIAEFPHAINTHRAEPMHQIIAAVHAQSGIWTEHIGQLEAEKKAKEVKWEGEKITLPSYKIRLRPTGETRVHLAKGFSGFVWKKQ